MNDRELSDYTHDYTEGIVADGNIPTDSSLWQVVIAHALAGIHAELRLTRQRHTDTEWPDAGDYTE